MSELLKTEVKKTTNVNYAQKLIKENKNMKTIGTTEINDSKVKVIKQGACGANIWELSQEDQNKIGNKKTDFLVVSVKDKAGKYYNYALTSIDNSKNGFEKALKNEKLEMLLSSGEFTLNKIIITNNVFDCQTFVNETLNKEGLKSLDSQPIKDVKEALNSFKVPFMPFKHFFNDKKNIDLNKIDNFFNSANSGDVVLFVKKVPEKEVKELEKSIDLIYINGVYYSPVHVTLYIGKDSNNKPNIAQAHIYGGTITEQPFSNYSTKNRGRYDGVFIIPKEYFEKN